MSTLYTILEATCMILLILVLISLALPLRGLHWKLPAALTVNYFLLAALAVFRSPWETVLIWTIGFAPLALASMHGYRLTKRREAIAAQQEAG